jgi:hypothetical protein
LVAKLSFTATGGPLVGVGVRVWVNFGGNVDVGGLVIVLLGVADGSTGG